MDVHTLTPDYITLFFMEVNVNGLEIHHTIKICISKTEQIYRSKYSRQFELIWFYNVIGTSLKIKIHSRQIQAGPTQREHKRIKMQ